MSAELIDGKAIASSIRDELKAEIKEIRARFPSAPPPGLATVLVGERKDSQTYVRIKRQSAEEIGMHNFEVGLPHDATHEAVLAAVRDIAANPLVHGIIVQLPLPPQVHEREIILAIPPCKDADCLHPHNVGLMALRAPASSAGRGGPLPAPAPASGVTYEIESCTPAGCIELLDRSRVQIEGATAVVVGRSAIVGLPVSLMLLRRNATVTVCHSRTPNLPEVLGRADIVIAAMGKPGFVQGEWLKKGAVVIDVGTSPVPDASVKSGYRLVGDCALSCREPAAKITPVPGGVGPMTVAMLLRNTVRLYAAAQAAAAAAAPPS